MKDYPIIFSAPMVLALLAGRKTITRRIAWSFFDVNDNHTKKPTLWQRVQPGDRMWVREGWRWNVDYEDTVCYRADYPNDDETPVPEPYFRWRSPLHLARANSRLTLTVTATKIERLQKITDADVRAEGVPQAAIDKWRKWLHPNDCPGKAFGEIWDALHGNGAWEENPEVIALSFMVHKQNIDALAEAA